MTFLVKKAEMEGRARAFFDFIIIEGTPGQIKWENGKIFYKNRYEAMFYHLIRFKTVCKSHKTDQPIPNTFYFTSDKILS
jgi:hypothetical protein